MRFGISVGSRKNTKSATNFADGPRLVIVTCAEVSNWKWSLEWSRFGFEYVSINSFRETDFLGLYATERHKST
jgi:hypothetical protein